MTSTYGTVQGGYTKTGKIVTFDIALSLSTAIPVGMYSLGIGLPLKRGYAPIVGFVPDTGAYHNAFIAPSGEFFIFANAQINAGYTVCLAGAYIANLD